jgi:CheY-like chemotaxis protein/HPt (histidine-containing phosphotransfer) domain-containing protein
MASQEATHRWHRPCFIARRGKEEETVTSSACAGIDATTRKVGAPGPEPAAVLRVLLAEDNPVNSIVATRTLEKRGHRVTLVSNGAAAVEAFKDERFDVILMDVQMPEMDGLEATKRIREVERGALRRIPIIALTAHALKGDRERCLAAGMDDYMTKPFRAADLIRAVESRWGPLPSEGPSNAQVLNRTVLLERVDGDESLASELARVFLQETGPLLDRLRTALRRGDLPALGVAAHRLRGTLITIGADCAAAPAFRLERASRGGHGDDAAIDLTELEREISRLEPELVELAAG